MLEANKSLVRNFFKEVIHERNPDAADRYLAPDFRSHTNPTLGWGPEGYKAFARQIAVGFDNFKGEVQAIVAEDDLVMVRTLWRGKHVGDFLGHKATNNLVQYAVADTFLVVDGKLSQHWDVVDTNKPWEKD